MKLKVALTSWVPAPTSNAPKMSPLVEGLKEDLSTVHEDLVVRPSLADLVITRSMNILHCVGPATEKVGVVTGAGRGVRLRWCRPTGDTPVRQAAPRYCGSSPVGPSCIRPPRRFQNPPRTGPQGVRTQDLGPWRGEVHKGLAPVGARKPSHRSGRSRRHTRRCPQRQKSRRWRDPRHGYRADNIIVVAVVSRGDHVQDLRVRGQSIPDEGTA